MPPWLERNLPPGGGLHFTAELISELGLETVCDLYQRLGNIERRIGAGVADLFGLERDPARQPAVVVTPAELAARWISFALISFLKKIGRGVCLVPLEQPAREESKFGPWD